MALSKQLTPHARNFAFVVLLVLLTIVVIVTSVLRNSQRKLTPQQTVGKVMPTQSLTPSLLPAGIRIDTGDGAYAVPTSISGQMKFVSPKLGISFLYMSGRDNKDFAAKQEGNTLFVYHTPQHRDYHNGQYIEVHTKNPQDTLEEAIKKTVL